MTIKYTAYTQNGGKVEGILDTNSEEDAYALLERDELIPYKVKRVRQRRSLVQIAPGLFKPKAKSLIDLTRETATLLNAGIPLHRALVVLRDQSRDVGLKEALRQMVADVEQGQRFSDAASRHTTIFPAFYVRLLRIAESTGGLVPTMEQLADTLQKRNEVRARVQRALTYPAISLVIALLAGVILVTFSLPSIVGLLDEFGGEMPLVTRLLISVAGFFETWGIYVVGSVVGFVAGFIVITRTDRGALTRDQVLLRLPVVGPTLVGGAMFSITRTLSTLLDAGVPTLEALQLTQESLGNRVLKEEMRKVTVQVTEGESFGHAFRNSKCFPPLLTEGVVTGEATGTLVKSLKGLSEYFERETERSVSGATELIQPAVILIVAGIYSTIGAIG